MKRDHWLNSLALLFNFFYGKTFKTEKEQPELWLVPLVGMIPGFLCCLFSGICFFLTGGTGSAVLSAIFLPLFLEILTGWKGITVFVSRMEKFLASRNMNSDETLKITQNMQFQILFASMYLLRMGLFGLIAARGCSIWFLYALGGAYLIRGEYLTRGETEPGSPKYGNWFLYIIGSLTVAILSFQMTSILSFPIAFLVVWLLMKYYQRSFRDHPASDIQTMDFYGSLTENLLLILGLILSGGHVHG